MTAPGSRRILGILMALGLLAATVAPVSAGAPGINVDITASQPTEVTAGLPVGYPVTVSNNGNSTVNHATLAGQLTAGAEPDPAAAPTGVPVGSFNTSYPAGACSAAAVCDIGTLAAGASYTVVFVYNAPVSTGAMTFTATFIGGEGTSDSEGPASHQDTFRDHVVTTVLATSLDVTHQYALNSGSTVSTGIGDEVTASNKHGTQVVVPATARGIETIVEDIPANAAVACTGEIAEDCFGDASHLAIGDGFVFSSPLRVTIRFDESQLPNGMTDKKLRAAHIFDDGSTHAITTLCGSETVPEDGCYFPAVKLADKDLSITVLVWHNGNIRGW